MKRLVAFLLLVIAIPTHAGFFNVAFIGGGGCNQEWPQSAGGSDYTVTNGQTLTLTPGQTYVYKNLTVDAGGVIECAAGNDWVILGVIGNLTVNGTIRCQKSDNVTGSSTFQYATSPNGTSLSRGLFTTNAGGSGNGGSGGAYGNGGAGGQGTGQLIPDSFAAASTTNGASGYGAGCTLYVGEEEAIGDGCYGGSGGSGASVYGGNGGSGSKGAVGLASCSCDETGGGGGGARGYSGGALLIRVQGTLLTGSSGVITTAGLPGGSGGGSSNGYGGGGGAGGHGGKLVLQSHELARSLTDTISVLYGTGGSGGSGSRGNGYAGSNGYTGSLELVTIPKYCGTL